ncbi:MAG: hypothetical protein HRU09_09350 [Oligoflexales bacterium]|nr:hypothetical protein [Oligoflexales bacterium]
MNVIRSLAIICGFLCLSAVACKPSQKSADNNSADPRLETAQKVGLKSLETKPPAEVSQLGINSVSVSAHRIGSNQSALVNLEVSEEIAEFYEFEFCPQENPEDCFKGWYHDVNFIVPGLKPTTYKVKVKACTRKERATADPCGEQIETYYQQPENIDDELAAKIVSLFRTLPEAQNISFEVYNALLTYRQQLKDAGHEAPDDDIEVAINNILELGPYQNSAYYLSEGFDLVRDSVLEQQSGPSDGLLLTQSQSEYDRYHKPDPNEPSTFGKIMILGGLATVIGGITQFPNFFEQSPVKTLEEYKERMRKKSPPHNFENDKTYKKLETKVKDYPGDDAIKKVNAKQWKKGLAVIAVGVASLFIGFSTRANLTEDTQSFEAIRDSLLSKLESYELKLLEIVRERKALIQEIPF